MMRSPATASTWRSRILPSLAEFLDMARFGRAAADPESCETGRKRPRPEDEDITLVIDDDDADDDGIAIEKDATNEKGEEGQEEAGEPARWVRPAKKARRQVPSPADDPTGFDTRLDKMLAIMDELRSRLNALDARVDKVTQGVVAAHGAIVHNTRELTRNTIANLNIANEARRASLSSRPTRPSEIAPVRQHEGQREK